MYQYPCDHRSEAVLGLVSTWMSDHLGSGPSMGRYTVTRMMTKNGGPVDIQNESSYQGQC